LPGIDGKKMSKSRHNAIAIAATAEETARLLRAAKTDSNPQITYEPQSRPEVANLVLLTALCEEATPEQVAAEIAGRGAAELKRRATDAVNERLRPIRERRNDLMTDRGHLRRVLLDGSAAARTLAQDTLTQVSAAMHTQY
jgi:tryptophanyl-tRNA synthetase